MTINSVASVNNNLSFTAKFQKLPVKIKAVLQEKPFKVPNPWAQGEVLEGKAGDRLVTNLLNGEQYPIAPEALAQKYAHVADDIFETRMDKPVYIEADLPKGQEISSREGTEKVESGGMKAVEALDSAGKPYAIPFDYFAKAYAPIDDAGKKIMGTIAEFLVGKQ